MQLIIDWQCQSCGEVYKKYEYAVGCRTSIAPVYRCAICGQQHMTRETAEICCMPMADGNAYVPMRERERRGQLCLS